MNAAQFRPTDAVDFIVIGAGAAGGVIAKELSTAGFRIVVLEQGPWLREGDFQHDEVSVMYRSALTNDYKKQPNVFRKTAAEPAKRQPAVEYGRMVGGGSVHFTANYWRFHPEDFRERSLLGTIPGADLRDWPIGCDDLEPYYTKAEWDLGISGLGGSNPFDGPRSKPYPLPRPVRARGQEARPPSVSSAAGGSFAALSRTPCLRSLRFLRELRMRDRRQVEHARRAHSSRCQNGPVRGSSELLRTQDRSWKRSPGAWRRLL